MVKPSHTGEEKRDTSMQNVPLLGLPFLEAKSKQLRKTVLEMCIKAGTGHVSSCFSCVEILVALYYKYMKENDILIVSKGQSSPLVYAILADKGLIPEEELWKFAQKGGKLGVHLDHHINGVTITAGSLGHGLGIACGMALADRERTIFVLMGDGECYEGSVWEAVMFAAKWKLNNIVVIIDNNKLMVTDKVGLPLPDMWGGFGWNAFPYDGHSFCLPLLYSAVPQALIAHTVKGKGISFMENNVSWHGIAPKGKFIEEARECLK